MPDEEKEVSLSNIDVLWLKAIYEDIRNLGEHIILAKTGFRDIEEMISLHEGDLIEIQLRNLKLTIIKFINILDNVQTKVSEKFFKNSKKILKVIEKRISLEETGQAEPWHFKVLRDNIKHLRWKGLTDNFYKTLNIIDQLKTELIKELDPILYFTQEESPLDKTKQKKKIR